MGWKIKMFDLMNIQDRLFNAIKQEKIPKIKISKINNQRKYL